ncbi:MAG: spore germination protein, partial [Bacillota bacterium]
MVEISRDEKEIKEAFNGSMDFVIKRINCGQGVALAFIDGMVNIDQMELGIIMPLLHSNGFDATAEGVASVLTTGVEIAAEPKISEAITAISEGECVMLVDKSESYFIIKIRGYALRTPSEPPTSAVLKGPREGFTEDVKTNMVLLRRRLHTNNLIYNTIKVGRYTKTAVVVAHIKGIADNNIVQTITKKIEEIDIDGVIDASYVGKFLEERNYSIFNQTGMAEKPDIVAGKMLEGRVAIIVDGSPMVITLPFSLIEDFQDSQDYYKRAPRATMLRFLRLLGVFFAIILPATFVALQMHQFQILPMKLLITIINSINGIPFTPVVEMFIALVLFEILGEASVRMPKYVGMAVSIVGAIVLGETAVSAGLLSSLTVLITALSGIALYVIPDEVGTFSTLRFGLLFVGGAAGMFGLVIAGVGLLAYLVSVEIYGVPYLAPFAPITESDLKDALIKVEIKDMETR